MHKTRYNSMELTLKITPEAPLLIKAGGISPNPVLPDMQFVRTSVKGVETIYIPGSSMKGVFRSYAEKILRTKKPQNGACDIFDNPCAENIEKDAPSYKIYKNSCMACKTFGSTKIKSRIFLSDAYPEGEIKTETRYGVAISRLTQAVAQGPFEIEAAVDGKFTTNLLIENFELWQLGIIAAVIRGLNEGMIRIGYGKNRGFGKISIGIDKIIYTFTGDLPKNEIWGVGGFVSENERNNYRFRPNDIIDPEVEPTKEEEIIYKKREYSPDAWEKISEKAISKLQEALRW